MGFSLKDPIQGSITGNAGSANVAKKTQAALTIQKNGTTVGSTFDGSTARTINITVPTTVASLTDATNYIKKTDYASASSAGVIKLGTGLAIADGVLSVTGAATADSVEWSVVKNRPTAVSYWTNDAGYIKASNTMKGATSSTAGSAGTVPAPAAGKEAQFLRGDGTWAVPSYATSAGSATKATQDGSGNTITSTYVKKSGDTMSGRLTCATGNFGTALTIERTGSADAAAIQFKNSNGVLGYIAMSQAPDGGLLRWDAAVTKNYTILDTGNYTTTLDTRYVKKAGDTMTGALTVNSNITTSGYINVGTTAANAYLKLNNKNAIQGTDQWLRINPGTAFSSGIYCDTGILRTDGQFQVGSNGAYFKVTNNGAVTAAQPITTNAGTVNYTTAASITYNATDKCLEFIFR